MNTKSPYERILMAPRCRLITRKQPTGAITRALSIYWCGSLADACMPILSQVMVRHAIPRCQPLRPCEEAAMVGGGHVIVSHGHTRDMKVLILREQPVAASCGTRNPEF